MSNLKKYMAKAGLSQSELARSLGIGRSYLSEIANGIKVPSLVLAARIEAKTGGAVKAVSFVSPALGGKVNAPQPDVTETRTDRSTAGAA